MQVLPTRQSEVARLLARGYVPIEISRELGVPYRSVRSALVRLCGKYKIAGGGSKHVRLALALAPRGSASAGQGKALWILRPRQLEAVACVAKGLSNQEIGVLMGVSRNAVKNYLRDVFDRVGVWSRLELALWFIAHGGQEAMLQDGESSKQQTGISLEAGI